MGKILITSYENPDVDGIACSYAYAEFLRSKGINAKAGVFGKPHIEAQFVLDKYRVKVDEGERLLKTHKDIVFVDASRPSHLPKGLDPSQVVELIDHRKTGESNAFRNAKMQIELVGSCATLIAERLHKENAQISRKAAILLYSAIVSNTINFKGKVTTDRDKKMANWLKTKVEVPRSWVQDMFAHKSDLKGRILEVLKSDTKIFEIGSKKVGVAQLEIMNSAETVNNNLDKIKSFLTKFKKEDNLDYVFLNTIDLELGFNTFVIIDEVSEELVERSLGVKFSAGVAKSDHIIMRKEIVPKLKVV